MMTNRGESMTGESMTMDTMIRSDKSTVAKLHQVLNKPIASWLRDVAYGRLVTVPATVESRLDTICAILMTLEQNQKHMAMDMMECPEIASSVTDRYMPKTDKEPVEMSDADMGTLGKLIMGSPDTKDKDNA
jgi:hypothetical protein